MDDVKHNIMSLKTNTIKDISNPAHVIKVYGSVKKPKKLKIQQHIKNMRNLFRLKKENEAIKDRIIRDIKKLFEQEEDYH